MTLEFHFHEETIYHKEQLRIFPSEPKPQARVNLESTWNGKKARMSKESVPRSLFMGKNLNETWKENK